MLCPALSLSISAEAGQFATDVYLTSQSVSGEQRQSAPLGIHSLHPCILVIGRDHSLCAAAAAAGGGAGGGGGSVHALR